LRENERERRKENGVSNMWKCWRRRKKENVSFDQLIERKRIRERSRKKGRK
jgi:hypothetical protein